MNEKYCDINKAVSAENEESIDLISIVEEERVYPACGSVKEYRAACFKITTPSAVYFYDKSGGGFASIIDSEGKDWISFSNRPGSEGMFRGIPNSVHPEDVFHPGRETVKSRIASQEPLKVTILSESKDEKWSCMWEIYPDHATMTMLKMDHPYWFLYEGTPYGKLDINTGYFALADGRKIMINEYMDKNKWSNEDGASNWVAFGDTDTDRVLYLIRHGDNMTVNSYYTMEENMTVFGFGRLGIKKFIDTVPARFTIGFAKGEKFSDIKNIIDSKLSL